MIELIRVEPHRLTGTTQIEFDPWREHDRLHRLVTDGAANAFFRMCFRFEPQSFNYVVVPVIPDDRQSNELAMALHTGAHLPSAG